MTNDLVFVTVQIGLNCYFFDSDCLSAFLWFDGGYILRKLYVRRIILPKPVCRADSS